MLYWAMGFVLAAVATGCVAFADASQPNPVGRLMFFLFATIAGLLLVVAVARSRKPPGRVKKRRRV